MEILNLGERVLTELDHARIRRLVRPAATPLPPAAHPLVEVLAEAELRPSREVPHDVVTMYSRVRLLPLDGAPALTLTLCYPADADPARGFVSVLSPLGMSVLGLRAGDEARWRLPGGWEGAARVDALLFQPEASGVYTL